MNTDEALQSGFSAYLDGVAKDVCYTEHMPYVPPRSLYDDFVYPRLRQANSAMNDNPLIAWNSLVRSPAFVVFGPAGAGKTSLLRRLVLSQCDQVREDHPDGLLPVYLAARSIPRGVSLRSWIRNEVERHSEGNPLETMLTELWSRPVLILLDGVDEVEQQRRSALLKEINDIRDSVADCRIGIASRPHAISVSDDQYDVFSLNGWSESDLYARFSRRDWGEPNRSEHTQLKLRSLVQDELLKPLLSIPLFCEYVLGRTLLDASVPTGIADIIGDMAKAWLSGWDASRVVRRWSFTSLDESYANALLGRLADQLFRSGTDAMNESHFLNTVDDDSMAAKSWISFLCNDVGILNRDTNNGIRFAFSTIQDYYAALHLVTDIGDDDKLWAESELRPAWIRVLLIASGIVSNVSKFIERTTRMTGVDALHKGLVLSSLLLQRKDVGRSLAKHAADSLAHMVGETTRLLPDSLYETKQAGPRAAFALRGEASPSRIRSLINLLKYTYSNRNGRWKQTVMSSFEASDAPACEWLADAMKVPGELLAKSAEVNGTAEISASIVQDNASECLLRGEPKR